MLDSQAVIFKDWHHIWLLNKTPTNLGLRGSMSTDIDRQYIQTKAQMAHVSCLPEPLHCNGESNEQ